MKKNSLIVLLILVIIGLVGYIIYDKANNKSTTNNLEESIEVVDVITLDYVSIYLTDEGYAYISPINPSQITSLEVGNNLKERLNTLYDRAFYFDIFIDNYKLKGFRVKLDSDIIKIRQINLNDNIYVAFIKDNNSIGLFNYEEYYNLLYTNVIDNYNNYKNIEDIVDNKIIYLDGSKIEFKLEK